MATAQKERQTKKDQTPAPVAGNALALMKKDVVDVVAGKVREFQASNQLHLPANYSPENAMKSAWLNLQTVEDRNGKKALEVCTRDSVANALLDMIVQGLNPVKKQNYFIVYGKQLVCQRSYFGTMAVAKMVDPNILDIVAEVVYEGDELEYSIKHGRKEITEHRQSLDNIDKGRVKAAYCVVRDRDGEPMATEIMTMDEIKQAWKQSKVKPVNDKGEVSAGSTHGKFTAEMAKKTVINRTCKAIINASSDNHLLLDRINRAEDVADEAAVEQEIAEEANGETIDVTPEPSDADRVAEKVADADHVATGPQPDLGGGPEYRVKCPETGETALSSDDCSVCGAREGCPAHEDEGAETKPVQTGGPSF